MNGDPFLTACSSRMFLAAQFEALLVTYGLLFGTGASLVYTPSLVVLGHYFERRLGLVNGLCAMGSSVFTFIMPFVMTSLLSSVDIRGTLLVLAGQSGNRTALLLRQMSATAHSTVCQSLNWFHPRVWATGRGRRKLRRKVPVIYCAVSLDGIGC